MSDRVLVPLPDGNWLALSREAFDTALAEGRAAAGPPATMTLEMGASEPLLEASELATALKLPVSWIEQAAREHKIPSVQAGRWRRFKRSAVERALSSGNGAERTA